MGKKYVKPVAKKVEFSFGNQVVVASPQIPTGSYWDVYKNGGCVLSEGTIQCMGGSGQTPNQKNQDGYDCANFWSLRG